MTSFSKSLVAGLALSALAAGSSTASAAALHCEIDVSHDGGTVSLAGVVHAPAGVAGSYRFRVAKSGGGGSSDIDQSGGFSVGSGGSAAVGSVSLGGGGSYLATLSVSGNGATAQCSQRVRGAL